MPSILLDTERQRNEQYINGMSVEEYMNALADAMEPLLDLAGIRYTRAGADTRSGEYDLRVALCTNAAQQQHCGLFQGPIAQYRPKDTAGKEVCEIAAKHLREVYFCPTLPCAKAEKALEEHDGEPSPLLLLRLGFRDHMRDAHWMRQCLPQIADALVCALAEHFGKPYAKPDGKSVGRVRVSGGFLHMRCAPHVNAAIVGCLRDGEQLAVLRRLPGWLEVENGARQGYVSSAYVELSSSETGY